MAKRQISEPSTTALREQWLHALAAKMKPIIDAKASIEIPAYRVACGFPSKGGELGKKTRVRGQCWSAAASDDQHAEIFISPVEDDADKIAAILAHELIHAALPLAGHKRPFQVAATKIGHTKPFTTSEPTEEFMLWAAPLISTMGPYPHKRLNALVQVGEKKKQGARMLKCECEECGYTVRTTRKWLDEAGTPICPRKGHGRMVREIDDDES